MCYMVKRIIYFLILTCFLLFLGYENLQAQSKIEGFYGLRLGMPKNQVTSILNSKSKTYKQTESGNLRIDNAQLGDIEFDALIVGFKMELLHLEDFFVMMELEVILKEQHFLELKIMGNAIKQYLIKCMPILFQNTENLKYQVMMNTFG